jgi:hypothetical protein
MEKSYCLENLKDLRDDKKALRKREEALRDKEKDLKDKEMSSAPVNASEAQLRAQQTRRQQAKRRRLPSSELSMGLDDMLQGGRQDQQSILFDIFVDNNSRTSGEESARTSTTTSTTTTESSGSSRTVKTRGANSMAIAVGTAATGIGAEIADDGYRKTIWFADHTTVIRESYDGPGEQSLTFLDVYGQSDNDTPQNSVGMDGIAMGNESDESLESIQIGDQNDGEDDDASFVSACSGEGSDDEETRIKRQLLWAVGGIGAMAFLGWAGKKIMNRLFNNDEDVDVGGAVITHRADDALTANDVATAAMHGDAGTTAATTGMVEQQRQP